MPSKQSRDKKPTTAPGGPVRQSGSRPGAEQPRRGGAAPTRPADRGNEAAPRRDGGRAEQTTAPRRTAERGQASRYGERQGPRSARLEELRSEKRDRFSAGGSRGKKKGWLYVVTPLAIVALVGVVWFFSAGEGEGFKAGAGLRRSSGVFTTVVPENGTLKVPVADLQDGKARYYTYKTVANKEIDFFVLKSSDGVIRAAVDSCDVCFSFKKGYRQEGDEMVCNNCGQRFPSVKINEIKGGCNPAPLTRTVDGDNLVINEKDIVADGDQYF